MKICLPHGSFFKSQSSCTAANLGSFYILYILLLYILLLYSIYVFTSFIDLTLTNSFFEVFSQPCNLILRTKTSNTVCCHCVKGLTEILHPSPAIKECAHTQHAQT